MKQTMLPRESHLALMSRRIAALVVVLIAGVAWCPDANAKGTTPGELGVVLPDGQRIEMPLQHTNVSVEISAFVARTTVEQVFANPFDRPVEALYTFPLGDRAAVDAFEMQVGDRVIRGEVRRREEARQVYEAAREEGRQAALLEQERPNVFSQSVANLMPGHEIRVRLRTVELVEYTKGDYQFTFPLVVGPRYFPGGHGAEAATEGVVAAVAERVNSPLLRLGERSGHDVSIHVALDAGVPVRKLSCPSHRVRTGWHDTSRVTLELENDAVIPNKDFVLRWNVSSERPAVGLLTHRSGPYGFFALLVQPKGEVESHEAMPKEIILVLDTSGSMSGLPMEMSRSFAGRALDSLGDRDTFNLIQFAGGASVFSRVSLDGTAGSLSRAHKWIGELKGEGGTEMLTGLRKAVAHPPDPDRLRMIVFLTDGYIGNERQILDSVARISDGARVFTVGIGSSVNHYLLDRMARVGGGSYTFIPDDDDAERALSRLHDWITRPYLTDLEVDWGALPVVDPLPESPRDLFSGETLSVIGRYLAAAEGTITVRGRLGGSYWEQELPVVLPELEESRAVLASAWARRRIEELLLPDGEEVTDEVREEVTGLALDYQLMSPYTSFVAVDYTIVANPEGRPMPIRQKIPLPEGVSHEAFDGSQVVERVMVAALSGLVDVESSSTATRFSGQFIQDLPVPGRQYQVVTMATVGVAPADQGGTVHASRAREFRAVVNGVSSFDPMGGAPSRAVNFDSIEEMEVIAAGASVEFSRAQGGYARVVQKQGSNEIEGSVDLELRSGRLDLAGKEVGGGNGNSDLNGARLGLLLSGPVIRDRLWYRLSHAWMEIGEPLDTTAGIVTVPTRDASHSDQLTWQVSPRNKLEFRLEDSSVEVGNPRTGALTPVDSATDLRRDDRSYSLTWTNPLSTRLIVKSTAAWEDTYYGERPSVPDATNRCTPDPGDPMSAAHCLDLDSQQESGPAYRSLTDRNRRFTLHSRATLHAGRAAGASHRLRMGLSIEDDRLSHDVRRDPRLLHATGESGAETFVGRFPLPGAATHRSDSMRVGLFLEDQIKPVDNLALTIGLRWDRERLACEALDGTVREDLPELPPGPELVGVRDLRSGSVRLQPSIRVAWDPWDDGRTSLFASARRYHDPLFPTLPLFALEPPTVDLPLEVVDGMLLPDPTARPYLNVRGVRSALARPKRDEWTVGFEREVATETKLRLSYIHSTLADQFLLAAGDLAAAAGTAEDDPPPGEFLELTTLGKAVHETWLLELIRRRYRSWEMQASYAWSARRGNGDPLNLLLVEDGPLTDGSTADLADDRRHELTVRATAIPRRGLRLGGAVTWLSGLPYSALTQSFGATDPEEAGIWWPRQDYVDGIRNDSRNRSAWNVDLKVAKEMNLGRTVNLQLWIEVYNLFDDRTYVVYNRGIGVGRTINGVHDASRRFGRRFQLGMQLRF